MHTREPCIVASWRKFLSSSILTGVFLVGSLFAQKKDDDVRLMKYQPAAARPAISYKDSTFTLTFSEQVISYQREEFGSNYVQAASMTKMDSQWKIGNQAQPKVSMADGQSIRRPPSDTRIKLIPYEGKAFLKIESKKSPGNEDRIFELQYGGTYEAKILEGSVEDYKAGGRLVATITEKDWQRYLNDLISAFSDEKFLTWNASNFKGQLVGEIAEAAKNPQTFPGGPGAVELTRHAVENATVEVIPSVKSTPEVFVFEGDTLTVSCESVAVSLLYKTTLGVPAPAPATGGRQNWREKMNYNSLDDFSEKDHQSGEPADPLKGLPGKQWPGWWPGW